MPDNTGYMVAGYVVTAIVMLGYAISLAIRIRRLR
jgi:hypothetical protein